MNVKMQSNSELEKREFNSEKSRVMQSEEVAETEMDQKKKVWKLESTCTNLYKKVEK